MRRLIFVSWVVGFAACESPEDKLDRLIDEGRSCEAGDTCVLAGGADCRCAQPVNEKNADEINAAADDISCCNAFGSCVAVECAAFVDIRCEAGVCTGD